MKVVLVLVVDILFSKIPQVFVNQYATDRNETSHRHFVTILPRIYRIGF